MDLYPVMDHRQKKGIDVDYNVKWDIGHKKITCKNTSLCHTDMDVQSRFCEHLATSS